MSYKYSKGSTVQGDIKAADDTNRDTMIDFGEDRIDLQTHGSTRFKISGSNGEITFNEAYKFPTSDGSADQVLQTNGSGQLSFVDVDGGEGGGGGSSTPQVLKAGTNATFNLLGNAQFQTIPFSAVHFDTFTTGGWDAVNYKFVAGENGYYDISATVVLDELDENPTQYQLWLVSNSDHATDNALVGGYIGLVHIAPTPADIDMATLHINTIAHLSSSQSASLMIRQTGTNNSGTSTVLSPKNRTFVCIKKL